LYSFTVMVVHRKCVQWSQKSHCNAFWLLFTGCYILYRGTVWVQGYNGRPRSSLYIKWINISWYSSFQWLMFVLLLLVGHLWFLNTSVRNNNTVFDETLENTSNTPNSTSSVNKNEDINSVSIPPPFESLSRLNNL
jgi:hypothetical protein